MEYNPSKFNNPNNSFYPAQILDFEKDSADYLLSLMFEIKRYIQKYVTVELKDFSMQKSNDFC